MSQLLFLILGALLAFASFVRADDKLRVYSFAAKTCDGSPQLVNVDIGRNECHDLAVGAQSFRPFKHENNIRWLDDINNGTTKCDLVAYRSHGCLPETIISSISLPQGIQQCLNYAFVDPALSIQFVCRSTVFVATATVTATETKTSWSFGPNEKPTPHVVTVTSAATTTATQTIIRRAAEPTDAHLEPRQVENNHRGLWMFHPWSLSLICYDCYTYNTDDFTEFDCRSGPNNPIDCGIMPAHGDDSTWTTVSLSTIFFQSPTLTVTPVVTSTVHTGSSSTSLSSSSVSTTIVAVPRADTDAGNEDIEKRSWHTRVKFNHPYKVGVKVCADAEWEKRGQSGAEIRLQKIGTDMSKCIEDDGTKDLNVPADVVVVFQTLVTTSSLTVASSTRTTTISIARRDHGEQSAATEFDAVPTHRDL